MRNLLSICFTLFLLSFQTVSSAFPGATVEDYQSFWRGICNAIDVECDLSPIPSCWNDITASSFLTLTYKCFVEVANSTPETTPAALSKCLVESEPPSNIMDILAAMNCESNLSFAQNVNKKLGMNGQNLTELVTDVLRFANARPKECWIGMRHMAALVEQRNFEALGILDGAFSNLVSLERKKAESSSFVPKTTVKDYEDYWRGMCIALDLECDLSGIPQCWNDETATLYMNSFYRCLSAVGKSAPEETSRTFAKCLFESEPPKNFGDVIAAMNCESRLPFAKKVNEKLGMNAQDMRELAGEIIQYASARPFECWTGMKHLASSIEQGNYELLGLVDGNLAWLLTTEKKKARDSNSKGRSVESNDL